VEAGTERTTPQGDRPGDRQGDRQGDHPRDLGDEGIIYDMANQEAMRPAPPDKRLSKVGFS
jgi:hypothetical protein